LRQGGSLSQQDAEDLQDEKDIREQVQQELRVGTSRKLRVKTHGRRYGNCRATGHNARTCDIIEEASEEEDSE
jgi:hypothetical protein